MKNTAQAEKRVTQGDDVFYNVGRMIIDASGALNRAVDVRARALGITGAQWVVLLRIGDGLGNTPGQLCETIGYDSGAMTKMLSRLEDLGFIRRRKSSIDRRSNLISLTARGRALHPKLRPIADDVLKQHLMGFNQLEEQTLIGLLQRILENGLNSDRELNDE